MSTQSGTLRSDDGKPHSIYAAGSSTGGFMTYSTVKDAALRVKELKDEYSTYVECKLVRSGNDITVVVPDLRFAKVLSKEGFDVYVQ